MKPREPCAGVLRGRLHPIIVAVSLAVAACIPRQLAPTATATLEASLMDRSLLTGQPCEAPCWYGLELGRTTKAEAEAMAGTLSFIDPTASEERPDGYWDPAQQTTLPATFVHLKCRQPERQTCAGLLFVNDTLRRIHLSPNYPLRFADVVTSLGDPDYVQVFPAPGHEMLCDVGLIWKERRISVDFLNEASAVGPVRCEAVRGGRGIEGDLAVQQVVYMLPDDVALTTVPQPGRDFPWTGFSQSP